MNRNTGDSLTRNMDDPNEENIEDNWVFLNPVDIAEEAVSLDNETITNATSKEGKLLLIEKKPNSDEVLIDFDSEDSNSKKNVESDSESDGISIISESSHLHDNTDEEIIEETLIENVKPERETKHVEKNYYKEAGLAGEEEKIENYIEDVEPQSDKLNDVNKILEFEDNVKNINGIVSKSSNDIESLPSEPIYQNCLDESVRKTSEKEKDNIQFKSDCTDKGIGTIPTGDMIPFTEMGDSNVTEDVGEDSSGNDRDIFVNISLYKKYLNGFVIGTILLLSSSIFLGRYFNTADNFNQSEDLLQYDKEYFANVNELAESIQENGNYEVPTALAYCKEKHKADDLYIEYNVNKCLRKIENRLKRKKESIEMKEKINNLQKQLKIKENLLNEKEKYLARKEYELSNKEAKIKMRTNRDETYENNIVSLEDTSFLHKDEAVSDVNPQGVPIKNDFGSRSKLEDNDMKLKHKKERRVYHKENFDKDKFWKPKNKYRNQNHERDSFEDYDDVSLKEYKYKNHRKYDDKSKYQCEDCKINNVKFKKDDNKNKEFKHDNIDCQDENNYKCKNFKDYDSDYNEDDEERSKKYKGFKDYSKQKRKYKDSHEKFQKEKKGKSKDKENQYSYEKSNYKYYNSCKEDRKDKKYETGTNYVLIDNKNDTDTISGYWVGKLYKGRNDIRNKESSGEWYFDRASYRKRKRDKARWYFDWMMDRELLRYKRSVYTDV